MIQNDSSPKLFHLSLFVTNETCVDREQKSIQTCFSVFTRSEEPMQENKKHLLTRSRKTKTKKNQTKPKNEQTKKKKKRKEKEVYIYRPIGGNWSK